MLAKKKKVLQEFLSPFLSFLIKLKIRPNHITAFSFILAILAFFLSFYNFPISIAIFSISFCLDAIDGALARKGNMTSDFGAFFDTTTDKIVEVLFIAAISFQINSLDIGIFASTFSIMISSSKYSAFKKFVHSFFDRAERFFFLLPLSIISQFFQNIARILLIVFTFLCLAVIVQIFIKARKEL